MLIEQYPQSTPKFKESQKIYRNNNTQKDHVDRKQTKGKNIQKEKEITPKKSWGKKKKWKGTTREKRPGIGMRRIQIRK